MTTNKSRTLAYENNLKASLFCHFMVLTFSFLSRSIFLKTLGKEYLGLTGIFANALACVSILELGLGQAIIQTLYEPLSRNDTTALAKALCFFKKAYALIGLIIFVLGISLTPFLNFFSKEMPSIPNINLTYFLYVFASVTPFFFAAEKSLIVCDQKMYIISIASGIFYTIETTLQIIVLIKTRNFLIYFSIGIILSILENLFYKFYAYMKYKSLSLKLSPDKAYLNKVKKNVFGMVYHKIGLVIFGNTDNILIAKFLGLEYTAMYSNYAMVMAAVNSVIGLIIDSTSASVGNLICSHDTKHSESVFKIMFFANFWMNCVCTAVLINCINPIISIWLGNSMLFSQGEASIILLYYFFSNLRDPVLVFRNAFGLFYEERKKPILQAVINILLSLLFAPKFGISGIYFARLITILTVCLWYEPYILYKFGFFMPIGKFAISGVKYIIFSMFVFYFCAILCNFVESKSFFEIFIKAIISFCSVNIMIFLCFGKTNEFEEVFKIIRKRFSNSFLKPTVK